MKTAPCVSVTLAVKLNDMSDDDSVNIEILDSPRTYLDLTESSASLLDLVVQLPTIDILYFKTSGVPFDFTSSLLGNEKSLTLFEGIVKS